MAQQKFTEGQYVRVKTGRHKGWVGRVFEVAKPAWTCGRILYNVYGVGVYTSHQLELLEEQPITVQVRTKLPMFHDGLWEHEMAFEKPEEIDEMIQALERAKFDYMFGIKNNDNGSK